MSPLSPDFLQTPGPEVTKTPIDFSKTSLATDYSNFYACVLDNVLTGSECAALLAAAESNGSWERAMINVGGGRQEIATDVRNCGRIIWDDRDVVARLWSRIEPHVCDEIGRLENRPYVTGMWAIRRKEVYKVTRLNERMRFLKYVGGEYFRSHCDAIYPTPDGKEKSFFTLHLYLNDETSDEFGVEPLFKGGATTFEDYCYKNTVNVEPKMGRVLVFQHRDLLHCGADVIAGTKYTLRTDVMYALEPKEDDAVNQEHMAQ